MQLHRWSGRTCLCARVVAGSVGDSFLPPPWMSCSRSAGGSELASKLRRSTHVLTMNGMHLDAA
jgi:hypothetical protein